MPLVRKPPPGPPVAASSAVDADAIVRALASGTEDERWSAARAAADLPASVPALGAALARERSSVVREALFSRFGPDREPTERRDGPTVSACGRRTSSHECIGRSARDEERCVALSPRVAETTKMPTSVFSLAT